MLKKLRADLEAIIERDPAAGHKLAAYFYIQVSMSWLPIALPIPYGV